MTISVRLLLSILLLISFLSLPLPSFAAVYPAWVPREPPPNDGPPPPAPAPGPPTNCGEMGLSPEECHGGGGGAPPTPPPAPPFVQMVGLNPNEGLSWVSGAITMNNSGSTMLAWVTRGAETCTMTPPNTNVPVHNFFGYELDGSGNIAYPLQDLFRTGIVTTTTTWTIVCSNSYGSAQDTFTINITNIPPPPIIVDIKANGQDGPVNVQFGQPVNFTMTSSNVSSLYYCIPGIPGATYVLPNSTVSFQYTPTASRTYGFSCLTNAGSYQSDEVQVNILNIPPPTVTLTADPITTSFGGASTLTWASQYAHQCRSYTNGSYTDWTGGLNKLNGIFTVGPLFQSTEYSIVCEQTGPPVVLSQPAVVRVLISQPTPTPSPPPSPGPTAPPLPGGGLSLNGSFVAKNGLTLNRSSSNPLFPSESFNQRVDFFVTLQNTAFDNFIYKVFVSPAYDWKEVRE